MYLFSSDGAWQVLNDSEKKAEIIYNHLDSCLEKEKESYTTRSLSNNSILF